MTNVVKFPGSVHANVPPRAEKNQDTQRANAAKPAVSAGQSVAMAIFDALAMLVTMLWPVLKWVVAIDVFIQFVKMPFLWHTPGAHPGLVFLLHFGVLTLMYYMVGVHGNANKKE